MTLTQGTAYCPVCGWVTPHTLVPTKDPQRPQAKCSVCGNIHNI